MKLFIGLFFRVLSFVIASLPMRLRLAIGDTIGFLWFDVLRIRRKVAIENVTIAFPDLTLEERTSIARQSLRSLGRTMTEYALFPFFKEKDISTYYDLVGEENLRQAVEQGKGAILLTLHVGNGDFAVAVLSRLKYRINLISKEFKARWLNDMWFGMRSRHGTRFISPEKSSFEILRALRRGEFVVFVLDQFMGPPVGARTTFFGKETGTAMGCALMAGRTGAPVIPCYTYRKPDGRHVAVFEEPIPFVGSTHEEVGSGDRKTKGRVLDDGLREKNIAVMTQTYTDKIEAIVRLHPGQWMWIHRRWKEFRD